jgi:hypothetical protein
MLFIGLHITKCAGTSLALHIRNNVQPHKWYLCSGFRDMENLAVVQLCERVHLENLQFIFGHFVHESLFSSAGDRQVFLFTGIRSPVERAISEFYHMCRIRQATGKPPLSADEFFRLRKNTMCVEILRAFPSLAGSTEQSLSARAIEISRMFDFVYDTENFAPTLLPLLRLMKISGTVTVTANTRLSGAQDADLAKTEIEIRSRCPEHFAHDEALYKHLKPHVGKLYPFREEGSGRVSEYRRRWEAALRAREDGLERLGEHFAKYFVADYRNLGMLDELNELIRRKEQWLNRLKNLAPPN